MHVGSSTRVAGRLRTRHSQNPAIATAGAMNFAGIATGLTLPEVHATTHDRSFRSRFGQSQAAVAAPYADQSGAVAE